MTHRAPAKDLAADAHPLAQATVFRFEKGTSPELAIVLPVAGGVLVAGDSYQNWATLEHCSWLARRIMPLMGFGPASIGKPWAKAMGPAVREDFTRLAALPWQHLIPGHGAVLKDVARDQLPAAIAARYGA